jgi:hypothetical protein
MLKITKIIVLILLFTSSTFFSQTPKGTTFFYKNVTTAQRDAIDVSNSNQTATIFNLETARFEHYNGSAWIATILSKEEILDATVVRTTGNQSIAGEKIFTGLVKMTDRLDLNDALNNSFIGTDAGDSNTTGNLNSSLGIFSLFSNTEGYNNNALGSQSLYLNTTGVYNVALGDESLYGNTTGVGNIGLGSNSGKYILNGTTHNETGRESIFIGAETRAKADGETNQIVMGKDAIGNGSNTVTLGGAAITGTYLKGNVQGAGSLTFASIEPTALTTGNVPYKSAGALVDSPISTDGTDVTLSGSVSATDGLFSGTGTFGGITTVNNRLNVSKSLGANFISFFQNNSTSGHGLLIQAGGTVGERYIIQAQDALGNVRLNFHDTGEFELTGNLSANAATFSSSVSIGVTASYADNAAAIAGGLSAGTIYRTGDNLKIVH